MDTIWMICNVIVYGFEMIAMVIIAIGIIGMINDEAFDNSIAQTIFDTIFKIDIDDETLL